MRTGLLARIAALGLATAALAFALGWTLRGAEVATPDPGASRFYFALGADPVTPEGRAIGTGILRDLDGDPQGCRDALTVLDRVVDTENFGGEYPSLQWYCRWRTGDAPTRDRMAHESADAARFLAVFTADGGAEMRRYITFKYQLAPFTQDGSLDWLDELLRFNSPARPAWEHTDQIMALLALKPGMSVADVGAGSGFFTFRFADAVGPAGKVTAVEINPWHLDYLRKVQREEGRSNLDVLVGREDATGLPPASVDVLFLCSTYQAIYAFTRTPAREHWLADARAALKPGGRLVISENTPDGEVGSAPPYRGFSISRSLIVPQLEAHGLRLVDERHFVPQRYLLVFEASP